MADTINWSISPANEGASIQGTNENATVTFDTNYKTATTYTVTCTSGTHKGTFIVKRKGNGCSGGGGGGGDNVLKFRLINRSGKDVSFDGIAIYFMNKPSVSNYPADPSHPGVTLVTHSQALEGFSGRGCLKNGDTSDTFTYDTKDSVNWLKGRSDYEGIYFEDSEYYSWDSLHGTNALELPIKIYDGDEHNSGHIKAGYLSGQVDFSRTYDIIINSVQGKVFTC